MTETVQKSRYNEDLFRRVLTLIKHDRSLWDQDSFMNRSSKSSCGTTHCIAGWAVALEHGTFKELKDHPNLSGVWIIPDRFSEEFDYSEESIETEAKRLLGLNSTEVDDIFYYINEWDTELDEEMKVSFNDMVYRIMDITGFDFSDLLDKDDADVAV